MHKHPLPSSLRGLRWGRQALKNRGTCARDPPESLEPECPKGMSLLRECRDPFHPFPQGSHLAEGFLPVSCCLVPGPCVGSTGRGSATRLCSSFPGHASAAGRKLSGAAPWGGHFNWAVVSPGQHGPVPVLLLGLYFSPAFLCQVEKSLAAAPPVTMNRNLESK